MLTFDIFSSVFVIKGAKEKRKEHFCYTKGCKGCGTCKDYRGVDDNITILLDFGRTEKNNLRNSFQIRVD